MPKEQSVAPKERINIVYKPHLGGAQEEKELPLKLLVVGDFGSTGKDVPIEERKPKAVDKDNFNSVMAGEKVELTVAVKDRLSDTPGEEMAVRLKFQSVSDFTPDAIAETVPELKQLLEIREALTWLRSPLGNRREFRKLIENLIRDAASRERLFRELGIEDESKSGGI